MNRITVKMYEFKHNDYFEMSVIDYNLQLLLYLKAKGMFLYSMVYSPWDCSNPKHFTVIMITLIIALTI